MQSNAPVRSIERSFEVLECVADRGPITASAVAEELNMALTTAHDHLQTLVELGCLVHEDEEYVLGLRLLKLGERMRERLALYTVARPELVEIGSQTGEFAPLMVEEDGRGVVLFTAKGEKASHISLRPIYDGTKTDLHTTATGKAIMAHLPEARVEGIIQHHGLDAVTNHTITDRHALAADLATVRDRGYAFDEHERVRGMYSIGVPIFNGDSEILGSIGLYGPTEGRDEAFLTEELPKKLVEVADVIEINLNN